ncbi:MAG: large-conductance mechanosensitive channel protein MscL [Bacteroidetes bacterium]|nr:large-conductance mechanosensitive channel protein MscL [Bacteroidota bacterium]
MLKEFQKFLQRGNVLDLAVAVVIGGAFGGIVGSFVKDLLTPLLGALIGKVDLRHLQVSLGGEAVLTYGNFLQAVIEFLIIAFAVFMLIKGINKLKDTAVKKAKEEAPEAEPEPTPSEKLLTEIRDLLKSGR